MNNHLPVPSLYLQNTHPLTSARQRSATNLHLQLTSFIGREPEIAEVKHLLSTTRLLTLVGPGGVGKTRLALQIAEQLLPQFAEGVWFVDLAPLTETQSIPYAIALALQLHQEMKQSPLTAIIDALQERHILIILDNCEHLIGACVQTAAALLAACPALTILATSREAFSMGGELIWRVPSLTIPPPPEADPFNQTLASHKQIEQYEAIQLFLQRAQSVRPTFSLTPDNTSAIAHICQRLDGIPLAIELAAAYVQVLSVEQIAARLDQSFQLLAGGNRAALPRQQTLKATLDWSHHLLSEKESIFFRRLSVLVGTWTVEDAEIVFNGKNDKDLTDFEVLDCLMQLVNKSLVIMEEHGSQAGYRMLEVVRHYGLGKLALAGEETWVRQQHFEHFLALTRTIANQPPGKKLVPWLRQIELAYDNLRLAFEWAIDTGLWEQALQLSAGLWPYWDTRDLIVEGCEWLEKVLDRTAERTTARAHALLASGSLVSLIPDFSLAQKRLEESLAIWRELDYPYESALTCAALAKNMLGMHQFDGARTYLEEYIPILEEAQDQKSAISAAGMLAIIFFEQGEYHLAHQQMQSNLVRARELSDPWLLARALTHLGELTRFEGDYAQAELFDEEALHHFQELGNKNMCAMILGNLAQLALVKKDVQKALTLQLEAMHLLLRYMGGHEFVCGALICLTSIALAFHEPLLAARLFGAVESLREKYNVPLHVVEQGLFDCGHSTLKTLLDATTLSNALSEGSKLSPWQAVMLVETFQATLHKEPTLAASTSSTPQIIIEHATDLTIRETEVLRLLAQALTNKQIAEALVISPKTVSRHIESIFSKIGVTSRSAATRFAIEQKLL